MPTLGEELKRLREARGLTLAEIAETTRISTRLLKAIENDSFSALPGGIFTRSFIRAFAKHVGMNEEEAVRRYQQQVTGAGPSEVPQDSPAPDAKTEVPIAQQPKQPAEERAPVPAQGPRRVEPIFLHQSTPRTSKARLVIYFFIVALLGVVVFTLFKRLSEGSASNSTQPIVARESEPRPNPAVAAPANPPSNAPSERSSPPVEPTSRVAPAASQPVAEAGKGAADKLVVKLEASSGDSWIKFQVDDDSPTQLILKQGQVQQIPAALNQIKLNYGNRQMLKLTINNREANFPPDTPKFRAQVIISRDNLQSFFQ